LAVGIGRTQEALPFFKTALESNPNVTQFWLSYIEALIQLDKLKDAKAVLDQAKSNGIKGEAFDKLERQLARVIPNATIGLQNQDVPQNELKSLLNLYGQGYLQQALDKVSELQQQFSDSVALYKIQGAVNHSLGKLDAAITSFKKVVSIKPDYAKAYYNMGVTLKEQGKLEESIEAYQKALTIKPDYAEACYNMDNVLKELGN